MAAAREKKKSDWPTGTREMLTNRTRFTRNFCTRARGSGDGGGEALVSNYVFANVFTRGEFTCFKRFFIVKIPFFDGFLKFINYFFY